MKKLTLLAVALCTATIAFTQTINEEYLREIRATFKLGSETKAIQNVLTHGDIKSKALNHELQNKIDHYFKYRVKVKGITDQKSSGRCWMFTSMNVLRPSVITQYNVNEFDFSHSYLYFWDIFEKANLFLENVIATAGQSFDDRLVAEYFISPTSDGGVWSSYFNVAQKYGVVPQEVMPETAHSNNTRELVQLINERLRGGGYHLRKSFAGKISQQGLYKEKKLILADVYRMLSLCLGEPPVTFTWRYKDKEGNIKQLKDYTPQQFYKEITPADYSPLNYIMIMNDPTRDYYKLYEIQNSRNTYEGVNWIYINLPNEDIKKAALASIKNNEAIYTSCDVGKQSNRESGILSLTMYDYQSLFGVPFDMDKKARILTHQSASAHAMLLIGCDTDENDVPVKWEFENSWGAQAGNKGYLTFTDEWFNEYMFRMVIHRNYLDEKAINSLHQKAIRLPAWDYMK
ncbi:Aminopeptidase C [termite gut metagenome]|uniref:Aminopeptidase C n=1 Tax=termite gut metagenome TaxID=433724 RepID=A0A5J4QSF6_9ZZZZ